MRGRDFGFLATSCSSLSYSKCFEEKSQSTLSEPEAGDFLRLARSSLTMFASPGSVQNSDTLEFDVCIAGGGAAGITLALELDNSGLRICLLEAGGFEPPEIDDDHPYAGEIVGGPYSTPWAEPYSLLGTRLRYFGGTTNHWGGWCRPLDEIDFQPRPFVPLSGWPLRRADLDIYYTRASKICEIEPTHFELERLPGPGWPEEEFYNRYDGDFKVKNFRFSPPTRFGTRYRPDIEQSSSVTCFLNSTVVEIEKPKARVTRLRVRTDEKEFFVKAGVFIMALGGIENARILLNSDRHDRGGVGNESDFVGRCFADHPGIVVGRILTSSQAPYVKYRHGQVQVLPHLSFREELLLKHQLVNFGIVFSPNRGNQLLGLDYLIDKKLYPGWEGSRDNAFVDLIVRFEPTPNPDSRVTLIEKRDQYGMRRVRLDWRLNDVEFESLDKITDLLARKVGSRNIGRFRRIFFNSPQTRSKGITLQAHHLGTTRMSEDPKFGVVASNCRVYSTENLFISGSSVFPTFGFANPTLTIVALAIRLADHLKTNF
jgi:choline dehydrogenase-like flavoprotein